MQSGVKHDEASERPCVDLQDEEELDELFVPVILQQVHLQKRGGEVADYEHVYHDVMAEGQAEADCLAVASNNFNVELGQLSSLKQDITKRFKSRNQNNKRK